MKDRVPLYPGRVKLNPVSGQPNTFDLVRADQPTQEGTPLNKASLLNDATAALYGLPNTAVPDDVLSKIKTLIDSANANANTKARIATGSYTGTGTSGASNPNSLTFSFPPEFLVVFPNQKANRLFLVRGMTESNTMPSGASDGNVAVAWDGSTVSWYVTKLTNAGLQLNQQGIQYFYFAIG